MKHVLPRLLSPVAPEVTLGPGTEDTVMSIDFSDLLSYLEAWVSAQLLYSLSCALLSSKQ